LTCGQELLFAPKATNGKEGGMPTIALTSYLERGREPGVNYAVSQPEYSKAAS
jgi:hypothetical protein